MKIRIIGAVLLVIIMGILYVATEGNGGSSQQPLQAAPGNNDAALKALSL